MKLQILIVDDDKLVNDFLTETVSQNGHAVDSALSAEDALLLMEEKKHDLMISDIKMTGMDGITLLGRAKRLNPDLVAIMVTAYGTIENAVKAMKLGAHDYLLKPITPDNIDMVVARAEELIKLRIENRQLKSDLASKYRDIVGKSSKMKRVFDQIEVTADARSTVLITGESGTGKELVARAIHYASPRHDKPFIKLNCAALPENLVEAELFGYEKGAFTGAVRQHKGRFELADTGTLLLDEISEMPMGLQAKLLRVLQEKEFERLGSGTPIAVDVRIIATTNRDMKKAMAEKQFREDLFYRLNVIPIDIAPLRERLEDIPLLANHFIDKYNAENNKQINDIDEEVVRLFMKYHWPGNVRELENYMERAVVTTAGNKLETCDFPNELTLGRLTETVPGLEVGMSLQDSEKYLILKTLEQYSGNKTKAAEVLNVTPRTIRNKLAEYNMELVEDESE
jgi:two-component system, NtrC family, response regulator AtoC